MQIFASGKQCIYLFTGKLFFVLPVQLLLCWKVKKYQEKGKRKCLDDASRIRNLEERKFSSKSAKIPF
jgi:flagellar biogenesis protein FliO